MLRVLNFLVGLKPEGETRLEDAFKRFAFANRRPGVVVLLSDFFDKTGFEGALRYFLSTSQDVFILHTLAREELEPPLVGDLKLVDMEDGDTSEVTVSAPMLKAYRRTAEAFIGSIKSYAGTHGMNYLLAPTSVSFDVLVLDYLRRRGLVE